MTPIYLQPIDKRIEWLEESIARLQAEGRPTDYLEERLKQTKPLESREVDIFRFKELMPVVFTERELNQMYVFGFVVDNNPIVDKQKLRSTQAYQFMRSRNEYLGF